MNRQNLQTLASELTTIAKNDIKNKVKCFMREVDCSAHELAYTLGITEDKLNDVLNGNGNIDINTFFKLLIATGNVLEIKPIEETPMCDFGCTHDEEEDYHRPTPQRASRPNVFNRPPMPHPHFGMPTFTNEQPMFRGRDIPVEDFNEEDEMDEPIVEEFTREPQPRDAHGRFAPRTPRNQPQHTTSPFRNMSREQMKEIIERHLWDSEIDVNHVSDEQLARFLEAKDKRMQEYKRMSEIETDPSVLAFKNKLKDTVNNNPHLRDWMKKFVGSLD